jgi:c-di-GMP-binding flagellar brake protein YcgR
MINETLRVQRSEDRNPGNYSCRIEDVSGKTMVVTWPTDDNALLPLQLEQMLDFSIVREGNAYSFSGRVNEIINEPRPLVTVVVSSAIERVQRRQDFRIKCLIPLEVVAMLSETSSGLHPARLRLRTNTYDLSASGVSLRSATVIPTGTLPVIKLSLPDGEPPLKISCRVAHCYISLENPGKFHVGIQFMNLEEDDRMRIVRFVYRVQAKRART